MFTIFEVVGKSSDSGASALSDSLKSNSTLTTLNLDKNEIGDEGACALSDSLKSNSTLTTLELSENSIGPQGASLLSDYLKSNSTLTSLDLSYNTIGTSGAYSLSDSLKSNSTLTTLTLCELSPLTSLGLDCHLNILGELAINKGLCSTIHSPHLSDFCKTWGYFGIAPFNLRRLHIATAR